MVQETETFLTVDFEGVESEMKSDPQDKGFIHATKRCPECYAYVSLRTEVCPACKTKLGEVDNHGMAKRTVNWPAYFSAFLAVLGFGTYIWWAFLR
jgi:uncharacterized paraquat-inducible protein A